MPIWLKLTAGLVLTLLLAALGAAAFAPLLIDKQQIRADLEADISLSLGRPTQIESIGLLQLLPIPRLRLEGLQVADSVAADAPTLATIDAVRLDAAIWPLLSGRLVLTEVLIDRPKISLPLASTPTAKAASGATSRARPAGVMAQLVAASDPSALELEAEAQAQAKDGGSAPLSVANPPTLPPIRRLIVRDGELSGPAQPAGLSSRFSLDALNLTAGPIVAGRSGRLDATFRLFAPVLVAKPSHQAAASAANASGPDRLGSSNGDSGVSSADPMRFSLSGLAEAEIVLANPLTEVALRPLRLRLGSSAGVQGPPIEIDAEVLVEVMTGRVAIDPFELIADRLRIIGAAQLFPTPSGLGVDGQLQVPAFDLRSWLIEQAALTIPGRAGSLSRVGGQFDVQLRGPVVAIDNAALIIDQAQASAAARLRLPQTQRLTPSAPIAGQMALAVDRLMLDRYLAGAEAAAAQTSSGQAAFSMPPLLPPLPPLPLPPETSSTEQGLRLQLVASQLQLAGLDFSSVQLDGRLLQDALELDSSADFYGGWLETEFSATQLHFGFGGAGPAGPDLRLEAAAGGVDFAALLAGLQLGAGKPPPITGLAEIDLHLNAWGVDPASIIPTLGGEASFAVRDGTITMVDLGQLITGTIGALGVSPEDAENLTGFSALTLSAKGKEGQFSSDDIQLRSNLLNIGGNGQLNLTTQQIALDLEAVMTKPPKGRGIKELEDIPIPISAEGPWADPRWEVDVRTALDAAARRALREDSGLFDEIEERTGIKGLGDGLRQILPGLLGR